MAVLILDMGGVLYDFQGERVLRASSRRRFRGEEAKHTWWPILQRFESGLIGEEAFAQEVVRVCDLRLSPDQFEAAFGAAAVGFYPGALGLLHELAARHELSSLSNSNALQWPKVLDALSARDPFRAHYPSHVSGFRKPDPRAFQAVPRAGESPPFFFDDRHANVRAAQDIGWRAHCVRGVLGLRRACTSLGLLG